MKTDKKSKNSQKTSTKRPICHPSFGLRALAFATDLFMIGLPVTLIIIALFGYDQMHTAGGMDVIVHNQKALAHPPSPMVSLTQFGLFMVITVGFWRYTGQTPGKKLANIRVVDAYTGQNAPYWKLLLRFLGYFLSLITVVGFFIGLLRKDHKTLHDLLSGTTVIRTA
jgi:uncharacterized RDD family membrane protein YckC